MNSRLLIRAGLVGAMSLAGMGLAGCGRLGALDRPGPLFAQHRAERDAAARANAQASSDSSATSQTNGDYTQANDGAKDPALQPLRSSPPPGMSQGPLGDTAPGAGGGVLPDPFADPNRVPR